MTWIKFADKKPKTDIVAVVCHEVGWMHNQIATYQKNDNIWVLYNPDSHHKLTLAVTHYIPIPPLAGTF
jgi:hypothetical protein